MNAEQISALWPNLSFHEAGWRVLLPDSVQFLGQPVHCYFETFPLPKPDNRKPNDDELALAAKVLMNADDLMPQIEAMFKDYHSEHSQIMIDTATDPHFYFSSECIELDGPERWSFAVSSTENEFITEVLCDGLEVMEATGD